MVETIFIIISVVLLVGLGLPQLLWIFDDNKKDK